MNRPCLRTRKRKFAAALAATLLVAAAIDVSVNGFGLHGAFGQANQRAVSASGAFTISSPSIAGDPGGTAITETVSNMLVGDYRERLVTFTPGSGYTPVVGLTVSAVLNSDGTPSPIASISQPADAQNMLVASNDAVTPGQPGGNAQSAQGGLYIEAYSCSGTWSSTIGAVASATDDRDYSCSIGGANGVLLTSYDVLNQGSTPTQWVVPPSGSASTILLRTRLATDGAADYRQNTLFNEQVTLTHRFDASSGLQGTSYEADYHACVVKIDATLWCWGSNSSAELGTGDAYIRSTPTQIGIATNWLSVTSGGTSTCAIQTNNTLWCWGSSSNGQLGQGDTNQQVVPIQVGALTTWASVSTGYNHTCATKTDGTLWCWGFNTYGAIGDGSNTQRLSPVQVGAVTTWSTVRAANSYTCARRTNNTLWCWGANGNGQLGLGDTTDRTSPVQVGVAVDWAAIDVDFGSGCGTKTGGTLWCWGVNTYGQLGLGDITQRNAPAQVGALTTWASVDVGNFHTCATRTDNTLWCAGFALNGRTGQGPSRDRNAPVLVAGSWSSITTSFARTCGIRTTGTLWCWGSNGWWGGLGLGDNIDRNTPTQIGALTTWATVSGGDGNTCATRTDGTLWCWGYNANGQLGLGDTSARFTPTQVGVATTWATVSSGAIHTCATRSNGTLWCWGSNANGQLGQGDTTDRTSPTQIGALTTWASVSTGYNSTYATRTDGTLWSWGKNADGELGLGDAVQRTSPTQLGAVTTWATASGGGAAYACATRTNGTLWCWGTNYWGQLGLGVATWYNSPQQVGVLNTWSTVRASSVHTCATRTDFTLWCWGWNTDGRLGVGNLTNQISPVQIPGTTWAQLAGSPAVGHNCALTTDASLRCWGSNSNGELGLGLSEYTNTFSQVGSDTSWASVSAGYQTSCARRTDGTIWCFGKNDWGALGVGDIYERWVPNAIGGIGSGRANGAV